MKDALTTLVRQKRKVDTRVTTDNKKMIINQMNKNAKDYGFIKIKADATVKEVQTYKKQFVERLTYDIVTLAVQEGNTVIGEIESRDLKKSDDFQTQKLGQFAKELAKAKKESDSKLTKDEKSFIDRGNNNIKGYGNQDLITLFENTKSKKQAVDLITEIKGQDPKQIFYDKQTEMFEKVFQKIGIVRENDIKKLQERIKKQGFEGALDITNNLIKSLVTYDSDQPTVGSNDDETELANARLDDMLIKTGIKTSGFTKNKKTLAKYKQDNTN